VRLLQGYRAVAGGERLPSFALDRSRLDEKIEAADRLLCRCCLCERRCGVDRYNGEAGFCGAAREGAYFFEHILWGEEKPLIPSHEIFFTGCNMRCDYCYSWEHVEDPSGGRILTPEEMAGLIDRRSLDGAVNVNLIGGEPTVNLSYIFKALRCLQRPTAVVWNSNFYMSREAMSLLDGVVDLYLGDFRFGNNACAARLAGTPDYFDAAARNFMAAASSGDLIIRHLLLPGHTDCCLRPIAEWISHHLPDVPFNLMFQYTPFHKALSHSELCRSLTETEEDTARRLVEGLGLNTSLWNTPLKGATAMPSNDNREELKTTITFRPDGRVGIMHLYDDLLDVVKMLGRGHP